MRLATSSGASWEIGNGYPLEARQKYMLQMQRGDPSTYVDFDSSEPTGINAPSFQGNEAFAAGNGTGVSYSYSYFLMPEHSHLLLFDWWGTI